MNHKSKELGKDITILSRFVLLEHKTTDSECIRGRIQKFPDWVDNGKQQK